MYTVLKKNFLQSNEFQKTIDEKAKKSKLMICSFGVR